MSQFDETIRVLHVDDEPSFGELAGEFLERADDGIAVRTASSAERGLDLLSEHEIDCLVSDYDMPGMDGIAFLEAVRREYPDLPFILYTGKGSEEIASEAISAGVTDYLQKRTGTGQYDLLANRIRNAVERHRSARELEASRRRRRRQHETLVELMTDDAVADGEFDVALRRITERAAAVLDVARINVWLLSDDGDTLRCVEHYDRTTGEHTQGMALPLDTHPRYFRVLEESRVIVADDAVNDPRTAELTPYLDGNDVGALLDATLHSAGTVTGVVCHEHVGGTREWAEDEISFAGDVADVVHRALSNRERAQRERALARLHEGTRRLLEAEDAEAVATRTAETVQEILGYPHNVVRLVSADGEHLYPAAVPLEAETVLGDRPTYAFGEGAAGHSFAAQETVVFDDVQTIDDGYDRGDARAAMYVPIGGHGTVSVIDTTPNAFDETDIRLAETVAANAAIALDLLEQTGELQRQNERLEQFASIVSHDLRNPLNVAQGRLELAAEEFESSNVGEAANAVDRALSLVEDLLALSRGAEPVDDHQAVDLAAVCEECWQHVAGAAATCRVRTDRTILADPDLLPRLLENLFENAVKHGGEDVTVTVGTLTDGFYVADDGPGIPAEERDRVLSAYYSNADGTGLGLHIVSEIADLHGWEVHVTRSDDDGTRFEIRGVEDGETAAD
ncbi:MAG: response regulator [Haloferacaceae archaeon]